MQNLQKYFEFKGTISGTNYFLRNLIASVCSYTGGYMAGYGIGMNNLGLITLGLVVLTPAIWFQVATIYKRVNSLFTENASVIAASFVGMQVVSQFFQGEPLGGLFNLVLLGFGLYLLFKNSNVENHEG